MSSRKLILLNETRTVRNCPNLLHSQFVGLLKSWRCSCVKYWVSLMKAFGRWTTSRQQQKVYDFHAVNVETVIFHKPFISFRKRNWRETRKNMTFNYSWLFCVCRASDGIGAETCETFPSSHETWALSLSQYETFFDVSAPNSQKRFFFLGTETFVTTKL